MLISLVRLCAAPPTWLIAAAGSLATCGAAFFAGPRVVPRLLQRHATLTYRDKKDEASSGCRYVAFVHAIAASAINTYLIVGTDVFDDSPKSLNPVPLMWRRSQLSEFSLGMSLGYFFLDAILVAYYIPAMGGIEMVAHHVAAFASVAGTLACKEAHMYTLALLATEWTTPFINFRWLLEKMNWKETRLYKANGLALLVSWIVVRIALFVWFFIHLYHRRDQFMRTTWPIFILISTVPPLLSVLNLMWFGKIVRGIFKAFSRKSIKPAGKPTHHSQQNGKAQPSNGFSLKAE